MLLCSLLRTATPVVVTALFAATASGLTTADLDPPSGIPGTQLTLSGQFDPAATHQVTIDGISASVSTVTPNSLVFSVPALASSGTVQVSDGTSTTDLPLPFIVLREVAGTFVPPAGVSLDGYHAGTAEDVRPLGPGGSFTALVEQGLPSTITVFRGPAEVSYLARVGSTVDTVTVDANSTARAMVLTNPVVSTVDDTTLALQNNRLDELPATVALADRITSLGTADYLDDPVAESLIISLVEELHSSVVPPAPAFKSGDDVMTYDVSLRELNPDPDANINPLLRHEKSLNSTVEPFGDDFVTFSFGRHRNSRLDWVLSLNEIDPFAYPGGLDEIGVLLGNDPETAPVPVGQPLAHGFVRAKLTTKKLDYFGVLIDALATGIYDAFVDKSPLNKNDRFVLDREPPAIYMITATSGNFWYGTDWLFIGTNNQEESIASSDPGYQWELSAATNVLLASSDVFSIFLSVKKIGNGYVKAALFSVAKTISAYRDADTPLTRAALLEITKNLARDLTKEFVKSQLKSAPEKIAEFSALAARTQASTLKQIDFLGKISKGLQALERSATLFSPGTLAMERALLVVGDPFGPVITAISPRSARAGQRLVIHGSGFGTETPGVTFCEFPTSIPRGQEPVTIGDPLPATVLETTDTRLVVEVPDGFLDRFSTGTAHLCITKSNGSGNDSYPLGDAGVFTFIDTPTITAIDPQPEVDGGVVTVTGTNFIGLRPEVKVDGSIVGSTVVDDTHLVVTLPQLSSAGFHNLTVAFGDDVSEAFQFTVTRPVHIVDGSLTGGSNIFVDEISMSNAANGSISVLEGFLLANGGLGRALTDEEKTRVSSPLNVGAGFRDTIRIPGNGLALTLNQALPAIASGDTVRFGGLTLDGTNLPAGTDGIILDGVTDARIIDATFQNFPGDGARLTNGTSGNSLERLNFTACGENGLFLLNGANFNNLQEIVVDGCGADGIHIGDNCHHNTFTTVVASGASGDGVELNNGVDRNTFEDLTISACTGNGLVLTNGALANRFPVGVEISDIGGAGIVLDGDGVTNNQFYQPLFSSAAAYNVRTAVRDCSGHGIRVENGASNNVLGIRFVSNCDAGGILLAGDTTTGNTVGRIYNRSLVSFETLVFSLVADCGPGSGTTAHGVHLLDAPHNTLTALNISGCDGDAVRLAGTTCRHNRVLSLRTGVSDFIQDQPPTAAPNSGAGLRITDAASLNTVAAKIPSRVITSGGNLSYLHRNRFANDLLGGVIIEEGATFNSLVESDIGGTDQDDGENANGANGIALLSGAQNNRVGSIDYDEVVVINACPAAAVLVDGEQTSHNTLTGLRIGTLPFRGVDTTFPSSRKNQTGVVVRNGAYANQIGTPGPLRNTRPDFFGFLDPYTVYATSTAGAAVTLDAAGGTALQGGGVENPNVVQSVRTEACATGLRITGGASNNFVFSNLFRLDAGNTAGVHIDANVIDEPQRDRNRLTDNNVRFIFTPAARNLFEAPPGEVGLLVSNGSSGNVIGESIQRPNQFAGALVDGSSGNWIRGNRINYYGPWSFGNASGQVLGVLLRDATDNLVGGRGNGHGNEIGDPFFPPVGTGSQDSAGIAILDGSRNTVEGNTIQDTPGHGVFIGDSPSNLVGGSSIPAANLISRSLLDGIHVTGQQSQNNHIQGNHIGTDPSSQNLGNSRHGVHVTGAAAATVIGGTTNLGAGATSFRRTSQPAVTAGNLIAHNGGAGVAIDGPDTLGNPVTYNQIFANTGGGIDLISGGNNGVRLDLIGTYGGGTASGTVNNLNEIPAGSTLHFYATRDDQGELFLAETVVEPGGGWLVNYPLNPLPNLTVTATTPDPGGFGDTTAFTTIPGTDDPTFQLIRTGDTSPAARTTAFRDGSLVVLALTAYADGAAVTLHGLTLKTSGTIDESTEIDTATLVRDNDRDGQLDDTDERLTEPLPFTADDGEITLAPDNLVIPGGTSVDLFVVYHSAISPPAGKTVVAELSGATSATASFLLPPGIAIPSNLFPVTSDTITLGDAPAGRSYASFQATHFPGQNDPAIIAPEANPDGDRIPNILEFLFGTDPDDPTSFATPTVTVDGDTITFSFPRANDLTGITSTLEQSPAILTWSIAGNATTEVLPGDPTSTVRITVPLAAIDFLRLRATLDQ